MTKINKRRARDAFNKRDRTPTSVRVCDQSGDHTGALSRLIARWCVQRYCMKFGNCIKSVCPKRRNRQVHDIDRTKEINIRLCKESIDDGIAWEDDTTRSDEDNVMNITTLEQLEQLEVIMTNLSSEAYIQSRDEQLWVRRRRMSSSIWQLHRRYSLIVKHFFQFRGRNRLQLTSAHIWLRRGYPLLIEQ